MQRAFADCYDSDPGLVLRFRHERSGNRRFHLWYGGKFHTWSHLAGSAVPGILLRRFFHGYSYGTTAIMIPIAFPLAMGVTGEQWTPLAVTTIAAVTCGAIFGDHCSPISDTTIMSSMGSASDLMDHVRTQIPYAVTAAIVAAAVGFLPAAAGLSPLIIIPIGIAVLAVIVRILGKSTRLEDLQKEEENTKVCLDARRCI